MFIIEYFLPYNNFIVLITLILFNIILISRRSYWYTFILGNSLILAILVIIGFNPLNTFLDIITIMIDFFSIILNKIWDIIKNIFNFIINLIWDMIKGIINWILDLILPWR